MVRIGFTGGTDDSSRLMSESTSAETLRPASFARFLSAASRPGSIRTVIIEVAVMYNNVIQRLDLGKRSATSSA